MNAEARTLAQFASATQSLRAERFNAAEEALADEALLALFKLRDMLVARDANSLACRVDEVMAGFQRLARAAVRDDASGRDLTLVEGSVS